MTKLSPVKVELPSQKQRKTLLNTSRTFKMALSWAYPNINFMQIEMHEPNIP